MNKISKTPFSRDSINVFLCLFGIALINLLPFLCLGIETGCTEPVFSITANNEPLSEVLDRISKATGYQIEINKDWQNRAITVNLCHITLEKGLKEILRLTGRPNYAMTINDGLKRVEIQIVDGSSVHPPVAGNHPAALRQKQTEAISSPAAAPLAPAPLGNEGPAPPPSFNPGLVPTPPPFHNRPLPPPPFHDGPAPMPP